ncbi:MAG: hypothetical protein RBT71_01675 [Flavobacteriales bacterium]|nr:hypothetical protein [Flavobacteriales bacterium]
MKTTAIHIKLKSRARRLLLEGNVESYMRTLRALHDLRAPSAGMA